MVFCLTLLAGDDGGDDDGDVGIGNFCIHAIRLSLSALCCPSGNARCIISIVAGVAQVAGMRSLVAMIMTIKLSLIVAPLASAVHAASACSLVRARLLSLICAM